MRCGNLKFLSTLAILGTLGMTSPSLGADLLFKTNFEPDVEFGPVYGYTDTQAWQDMRGRDNATGFTFPNDLFDFYFTGVQLLPSVTVTTATVNNHIQNTIRQVTGPRGTPVYELFQSVKIKPLATGLTQAPFIFIRESTNGDIPELYISYWFKHRADLGSLLVHNVSNGNWRTQFEFKTGGHNGGWAGDYRIVTNIIEGPDQKLYWLTKGDNEANGPWADEVYWRIENKTVPIPLGEWFFFEAYWKRSAGSDGRYWSAVNGSVIADHHGANMGIESLPITRLMIHNAYSGGNPPVDAHLTELSVWSTFPCGDGLSCYSNLTAPPGLKAK